MTMRVTNVQTTNNLIDLIMQNRSALEKKSSEISSGYKVFNASDDPGRAGTIAQLQGTLQRIERHQERISFGFNLLETQENVVTTASNVLIRAKELATQAANGSISHDVRAQIGDEVYQLRDQLASLANTQHQGMYLYGGFLDGVAPFARADNYYTNPAGGSIPQSHYHFDNPAGSGTIDPGKTDTREIKISDTDATRINTPGDQIFENALNALERLGRALEGYRTEPLAGGAPDGNGVAYNLPIEYDLQTQDILVSLDALDAARENDIETEISSLGARISRLEQTSNILDTLKINTEAARTKIQDADMFEAASQFTNLQTSLEGLMASASMINNLSLLNYI